MIVYQLFLFVIFTVLRKAKVRYTLRGEKKVNSLLFMDDLKLYGKSESEIKGLVSTV